MHYEKGSWEEVDRVISLELDTQKSAMRLKTAERRLFAFISMYTYIFDTLTDRSDARFKRGWCPMSAHHFLRNFAHKIIQQRQIVKRLKNTLEKQTKELAAFRHVPYELLANRHAEIVDPDRKIWKTLSERGLLQDGIVREFKRVEHILPNEPILNNDLRTGYISPSVIEEIIVKQQHNAAGVIPLTPPAKISIKQFYNTFIKSDEVVVSTNRISDMFNVPFEVLPGVSIRVQRRHERYINRELDSLYRMRVPFPSNYTRGLAFAYGIGKLFNSGYICAQMYMRGFAASAVASPYFFNKNKEHTIYSFSKIKPVLRNHLKLEGESAPKPPPFESSMTSPATYLVAAATDGGAEERSFIADTSTYAPSRSEKRSVCFMSTFVAEQSENGAIARWLEYSVSKVLGRRVSVHYAVLFLVNWAVRNTTADNEHLKRLSNALGVIFHSASGLIIPNVGFGSGMTKQRLREYAYRLITSFVVPILLESKKMPKVPPLFTEKDNDIAEMSSRLFVNNNVSKESVKDDEATCSCDCHGVDSGIPENLKLTSMVFTPNEERRQVYAHEYSKVLNSGPFLLTGFGVCGYQHPLAASSNKETLVATQRLKQRQIFSQREIAAVVNWRRFCQYFTPLPNTPKTDVYDKISNLNRRFVERVSVTIRSSIPCERVNDDMTVKFNSVIFPLGVEPDVFLRTKAGIEIQRHASEILDASLDPQGIRDLPDALYDRIIDKAAECVTGKKLAKWYHYSRPFTREEDFDSIPFFGVANPVFPKEDEVEDETATRCNQPYSEFWIKEDQNSLVEAMVAKNILSAVKLKSNPEALKTLLSQNNSCEAVLHGLREISDRDLAADRPRKSDDHSPWSTKNVGQCGRNTTEFSTNTVVVVCEFGEGQDDIFLTAVDTQRAMAQSDILYPVSKSIDKIKGAQRLIRAPDISPVYRFGGNPSPIVALKHPGSQK